MIFVTTMYWWSSETENKKSDKIISNKKNTWTFTFSLLGREARDGGGPLL